MSKTVTIPSDRGYWWECKINGVLYRFPAGTTQTVPDEVAALIGNINDQTPVPAPDNKKPGQIFVWTEDGGKWIDIPKELPEGRTPGTILAVGVDGELKWVQEPTGEAQAVQYGSEQSLTDEEKAQARNNIDALGEEDLEPLETRVSAIEEAEGLHKYGVSGIGQSASSLTRLWDSVGMTAQVGTDGDNTSVVNNFDDVTPFNRKKCVGEWTLENGKPIFHVHAYAGDEDYTEDGTKGDFVAVECPRAFYYFNGSTLGISAHQFQGWRPFDIFCRNHDPEDTIPFAYLPAYALAVNSDGKAVCLPGLDPVQGTYKNLLDAARTYKNGALSTHAILQPMAVNFYEWAMFTVEFATQNCQSVMAGATELRYNDADKVTFIDETHVLTNNYDKARVVGEYICITATSVTMDSASYYATHKILAVTRCDGTGTADASGTHQKLEVEDLGREYYTYDLTGQTEYRLSVRAYRTGSCNSVSTPSGSPVSNSDTYHPMKYRHRENTYGNITHTIMDMFAKRVGTGDSDYKLEWYYLPDPTDYTPSSTSKPDSDDLATDKFEKLDIETAHANYSSNYIKSKKYSEKYPDLWIPYETSGGSKSTYTCDYAGLVSSAVVRALRLGGSWTNGALFGLSYFAAHYAPSSGYASYGGDLCFAS